jgi:ATP-dependent DNA ligase
MKTPSKIIWPMGAELPKPEKLALLWKNEDYIAEVKVDGERIVMIFEQTGVRLFTRSANKFDKSKPIEVTHRWPQINNIDRRYIPVGTVLDGEAFSQIRRAEEVAGLFNYRSTVPMPDDIKYIAFDCIYWGTNSLENNPWIERRSYLERACKLITSFLIEPAVFVANGKKEFFELLVASGGEGVVLKHRFGKYVQGKKPANVWVKAKKKDTFDCIITGFKPAKEGKLSGLIGSVELSQYKRLPAEGDVVEYRLVPVCHASGIGDDLRKAMTKNPNAYLGCVAVVDAFERIPGGVTLKQPRIKYIRPEGSKDPRECVID